MIFKRSLLWAAMAAAPILFFMQGAHAGERYCREYTETIRIGSKIQEGIGRACLNPDGTWEKVSGDFYDAPPVVEDVRYVVREQPQVVVVERPYYKRVSSRSHWPRYSYGSYKARDRHSHKKWRGYHHKHH